MEPTIEISVEYLFFVLDYGVTHGCTIHVTKNLAADGSIIPHETSKCNGQEFCNYEKAILLLGLVIKIFKTGFLMKKTVSKSHVAQNRNLQ